MDSILDLLIVRIILADWRSLGSNNHTKLVGDFTTSFPSLLTLFFLLFPASICFDRIANFPRFWRLFPTLSRFFTNHSAASFSSLLLFCLRGEPIAIKTTQIILLNYHYIFKFQKSAIEWPIILLHYTHKVNKNHQMS